MIVASLRRGLSILYTNRHLDPDTHDISFAASSVSISGASQVAQHVKNRLLTFLKEHFLDEEVGTPYLESIFVKPFNQVTVEASLKARILGTPGVAKLTYFDVDFDSRNRVLKVVFRGLTDESESFDGSVNQ